MVRFFKEFKENKEKIINLEEKCANLEKTLFDLNSKIKELDTKFEDLKKTDVLTQDDVDIKQVMSEYFYGEKGDYR